MWRFYAHNINGTVEHVYPTTTQVWVCGSSRPIITVTARPAEEGEPETHWGWIDTDEAQPSMIYPTKRQLEMCFVYGMEAEIKRGRGRPIRLIIWEVT